MSSQTGLHYNRPCVDSEECLSFVAPPARNIGAEHWTEEEAKANKYCTPCRELGCPEKGKHVTDIARQDGV